MKRPLLTGLLTGVLFAAPTAWSAERLVFGSFQNVQNAENWASRMRALLNVDVVVEAGSAADGRDTFRVVAAPADSEAADRVRRIADSRQLSYWRLLDLEPRPQQVPADVQPDAVAQAETQDAPLPEPVRAPNPQRRSSMEPPVRPAETIPADAVGERAAVQLVDLDIGAQARTFFEEGLYGQSNFHPSVSVQLEYYRAWDQERQSLTLTPFYRYDSEDDERTHFDLREGFWTLVGDDWDLSVGVKQVFWGVTEFNHLVDVINQTDLVEDIDGEEKLGQPMVQLSLVRDWGILDLFVLPGFRERTFSGVNGRPRYFIPVDTDEALYQSSDGDDRIDGAIRWSHHLGPLEFGLYHFSGTSRAPLFDVTTDDAGRQWLVPIYPVVDQTGVDAQAIRGDWAFKLEAITRSNFPDRYYAFTTGFERTLVGAFGTRADLGLVVEYSYDDRGDGAFDTFYENDLSVANRWAFNDLGDTQALIGVTFDLESSETILSLEASRRLGETWTLLVESRAFFGADPLNPDDPFDPANKGASVAHDDYIELELTKYF
ncbi:MAG: hypothetical protein AB7I04_24955 [Pseudomonadales bacterium]